MSEFKRIFSFKNILIMFLLLLANGILIAGNREGADLAGIYDEMVNMTNANYENLSSYTEAATKAWRDYFEENNIDGSDTSEKTILAKQAREKIVTEAEYIDNYKAIIEKKEQTAILYASSGTYKENSFEYNNLLKTGYDLSGISESDVKLSNGIWLEKLFEKSYIHFFSLASVVFTVYLFFAERKNGLYYIVHSTPKGRGSLFFKRCFIVFGQSLLFNAIIYIESAFLLINMYGGADGLGVPAVSSEYFMLTSGNFTRIEFLALIIIISALTTAVMALFLWMILLFFRNVNIGMFFCFLICAADMFFYKIISAKSIFKAVKFLNVYYLIFPNEGIEYYNWGYSWGIFSQFTVMVSMSLAVAASVLAISAYISINRYFNNKENIIELMAQKALEHIMHLLEHIGNFGREVYKILLSQRIIIVLMILLYISSDIQPGVGVIYDAKKSYMAGYYEKAEGLGYGPELLSVYNEYKQDYEQFVNDFDYTIENAGTVLNNRKDMFNAVEENVSYIKRMNENGIEAVVINPYAYIDAIGAKERDNQELLALINVIAAIVISCGYISYEKKVCIHNLILSYKGRRNWLLKKMAVQSILILIFSCVTYGSYYIRLEKVYDFSNLMAPLKSIMIFENFIINPPIVIYGLIDFLIKLIMFISVQLAMNVVSIYLKYIYGFVAGAVIIIPQLLYMIGFDYVYRFSISGYIAFFPCLSDGGSAINAYWIVLCLTIVLGVFSGIYILHGETSNAGKCT